MVSTQHQPLLPWCTEELAKHERRLRVAQGTSQVWPLASWVLSKPPECIHDLMVARCMLTISFITLRLLNPQVNGSSILANQSAYFSKAMLWFSINVMIGRVEMWASSMQDLKCPEFKCHFQRNSGVGSLLKIIDIWSLLI